MKMRLTPDSDPVDEVTLACNWEMEWESDHAALGTCECKRNE